MWLLLNYSCIPSHTPAELHVKPKVFHTDLSPDLWFKCWLTHMHSSSKTMKINRLLSICFVVKINTKLLSQLSMEYTYYTH